MAAEAAIIHGDTHESGRKHHNAPDDELEESPKRRKHRHHHRHHRHHNHRYQHRHSNRKHGEYDEGKHEVIEEDAASPLPPPPSLPPVQDPQAVALAVASGSNCPPPDYDMEEGEIVEEVGFISKTKWNSEESCNIKTGDVPGDSHNLGIDAEDHTTFHEVPEEYNHESRLSMGEIGGKNDKTSGILACKRNDIDMVIDSTVDKKELKEYEGDEADTGLLKVIDSNSKDIYFNGHVVSKYCVGDNGLHGTNSPSDDRGETCTTSAHSLSHFRYGDRLSNRSSSRSYDHAKDRFRSPSISKETCSPEDGDGIFRYPSDHVSGAGDTCRDVVSGHNNGYHRLIGHEDMHHSHDRYRDDRELEMGVSKGNERYRGGNWEMDMDGRKLKDRGHGEWEMETGCRRDKDRDRSGHMDRKIEKEHDKSWDRGRKIGRDREAEDCRSMERAREKERARDKERERAREKERDWAREKERERARAHDRSRDMGRAMERGREKERVRDKERERERGRNLDRDRVRDNVKDKVGRRYNYESIDDHSNDHDKYGTTFRLSRHDVENHRDRIRKNDPSKIYDVNNSSIEWNQEKQKRDEDEHEDYQEKVSLLLAEQEDDELNRIKEESRRRRQAILEKYNAQPLQQQVKTVENEKEPTKVAALRASGDHITSQNIDSRSDDADAFVTEQSFNVENLCRQDGQPVFDGASGAGGLGAGSPKGERSDDVFCDDIFGESPAGVRRTGKADGLPIVKSGLHDNWDDAEGYYSYRFGEVLDGRYEITAAHGKGVFSSVVRAKDLKAANDDPEELAIKIIRNNDTMHKAGLQELVILKKLAGADLENRRHCVRFISHFKYRNHLCLVFESLHMNLREVLKKFGRNIGLRLTAVRAYAKQLFIALKHLKNCGVLHCDIKPDNMLVNEAKNVLKLCDFGNAMFAGKNEITPYLVSRFYRAPEIILGLLYDYPLDIWSVGCCLYELYTGKVLFPGPSNNDMLRLHMELKGPFPKKMLRKGVFIDQHFDSDLNFHATEEDPVTKKIMKRLVVNIKPRDIGTIITGSSSGEDPKMLANFKDILDKIFVLDPDKRLTVSQALNHPFITGK